MEHQLLSDRQLRFVEEYVTDCNARQAAIRSGYAPDGGRKLLKDPAIAEAIATALENQAEERSHLRKQLHDNLLQRAFYDPRDLFDTEGETPVLKDLHDLPSDLAACLEVSFYRKTPAGTLYYKLPSRQTALRELSRLLTPPSRTPEENSIEEPTPVEEEEKVDYSTWSTEAIQAEYNRLRNERLAKEAAEAAGTVLTNNANRNNNL